MHSRLFAGISFLAFVLALGSTLRLGAAECAWRWGLRTSGQWPMTIGNAHYFEDLAAEGQPAWDSGALLEAVRLNPRNSASWMALGLAAEQVGEMDHAAEYFLEGENVDRQYMPAWTSANFLFRQGHDLQFWRAAARAAAMSYDDPAPLIELADQRESNALVALERLGDSARLERGYLRFLIGQSRWREAQEIATRLCSRDDSANVTVDRELLLDFIDHLIRANEGETALTIWNRLDRSATERARHGLLVNQNFQRQPTGKGFDWRVTSSPRESVRWAPAKLEFRLAETSPDACSLLAQWVLLDPGSYRLRFNYQTEGMAEETGLRWTLRHGGREEVSSAVLAQAPMRADKRNVTREWNFRAARGGLYELAWIYIRVPGTTHQAGRAVLDFASLEMR